MDRRDAALTLVRALYLRWEQEFTGAGPWHDVIQFEIVAPLRDIIENAQDCVCTVGAQECEVHPGNTKDKDAKIAFRKAWDARVDRGA